MAIFGVFYKFLLFFYLGIFGILFLYLFFLNLKNFKIGWYFSLVTIVSLSVIFVFSYFSTPTIFSGRDQGSLSESAIRLSQNHKLEFSFAAEKSFFNIYGQGKALNFPGFNYTQDGTLKTAFPLGYASWLAAFYSIFGLNGLIIANGVSFLIFILSFYLLARLFLKPNSSLILILISITTFVFSWFFKFTLSENLALALLWFFIYELVLFFKNKEKFFFLAALFSLGLLTFVRIEALAFFVVLVVILFYKYGNWKNICAVIGKKICFFTGGIFLFFLSSLFVNQEFYLALAKAVLKPFVETKTDIVGTGDFFSILSVGHILATYALLHFLILGIIGIIYLLKQKKWETLIPFLIVSPALFYLFVPSISADSPWMLRRFLFAVVPVSIFYTIFFLDIFFKKRIYFYILSFLLLIINLGIFIPYLDFSPNKNLLPQIQTLSEKFSDSDLILIDQEATGDQWSMMTGPMNFLFGKQAVYFFNPKDLDKLDLKKYNRVYFIIPDKNISFYEKFGLLRQLQFQENYSITNNYLDISERFDLPLKSDMIVTGKIYSLN